MIIVHNDGFSDFSASARLCGLTLNCRLERSKTNLLLLLLLVLLLMLLLVLLLLLLLVLLLVLLLLLLLVMLTLYISVFSPVSCSVAVVEAVVVDRGISSELVVSPRFKVHRT